MPKPPWSSGTDKAVKPCSASLARSSAERPEPVCQISRSFSGTASTIRKRLTESRSACWSSVKVKSINGLAQYLGKPSIRSAMMLRWISLLPA